MKIETCKKRVYTDSFKGRSCRNTALKDGFCKVHQKESIEARRIASEKRWEEQQKQSPYYKLHVALKRIAFLEEAISAKDKLIDELQGVKQ